MHISLSAEELWHFGPLIITNSLLTTWLTIGLLTILAVIFRLRLQSAPQGLQNILEAMIDGCQQILTEIFASTEKARKLLPLILTTFLFILCNNWFGLLPGVGSIGLDPASNAEHHTSEADENHHANFVPILRAGTADLSLTLTLALIAVIFVQIIGIRANGVFAYLGRFLNFANPLKFFTGILELISEFAKIISFSFRLFGNIFAGEVLLTVIIALVPWFAPVPFYGLEIFVGAIQALVFTVLMLVFLKIAASPAH